MLYDNSCPISIKKYGEKLIGKTFLDVIRDSSLNESDKIELVTKVNNPRYKGGMGHLIEEHHYQYKINSDQEPDFPKAGLELKVTPYEQGKKGGFSAGERLVITMISYTEAVEDNFFKSHVYSKARLTLLIHYLRDRTLPRAQYPINFVTLFQLPEEDLQIIQQDYEKIVAKIKDGRAHELSEGDTMYLGACTKGSTAAKSLMPQSYYAPYIKAPKRAFCLKQSYMTYILNKYVLNKIDTYESIVTNKELKNQTFENIIKDKIRPHIGKSVTELCNEYNVNSEAKNLLSMLSYRILGIRSNKVEEFEKANIELKTVRIEEDNSINESISFPAFKFMDFIEEDWEDSTFNSIIGSKRFLFIVFKKIGTEYFLTGGKFWNIPLEDLEVVRQGWEEIQEIVNNGIQFTKKLSKNGTSFTIKNNLPGVSANPIIHIRPHSNKRYYLLENGEEIGSNPKDGDLLPDGRMMTKQCFWLNSSYIEHVLKDLFEL